MRKLGNLVVSSGKDQNGKNRWIKSGALFQREDGSYAVKLDQLPLNHDGWFSVFEDIPQQQQAQPMQQPQMQPQQMQQYQATNNGAMQPQQMQQQPNHITAEQIRQQLEQKLAQYTQANNGYHHPF